MAKKPEDASAYWSALTQLTAIIKSEYKNGGKLPPAPEMSSRLGVSRVTYGKALKTVCSHGLAEASQGRGGTIVQPPGIHMEKIGILQRSGNPCEMLTHSSVLGRFILAAEHRFALQMIQCPSPEKLYETLVIYNIRLLVCFDPSPQWIPVLGKIQREYGFPVITSAFSMYKEEDACLKEGLPVVQHDLRAETGKIVEFIVSKKMKNMLLLDGYFGYVDKALNEHLKEHGLELPPESCLFTSKIQKELLPRIRKQKTDIIMAEGGLHIYRQVCGLLMHLPKYRRPALLFREYRFELETLRASYPEIRILGSMVYSNEILGQNVSEMVTAYLNDGIPFENRWIDTFSIITSL